MHKRIALTLALSLLCAGAFAQQITRVAVIDLQKVYTTYYKDSQAVRAFEEEKQAVNDEIKRLGEEIKELQKQRLDVLSAGDSQALKTFDEALYRKAQFLSDYVKIKQAELDAKADALSKGDAFVQMLYRTVQAISESEGFSLVITSRNADDVGSSVLWFSPMIDITDKVIQALLGA
ncbi:MAG: OmpH family outer membrane protein [Spirochaetales bacterium]|nr:OmpH family outer membrane protein [Spirochaetales bacterium]